VLLVASRQGPQHTSHSWSCFFVSRDHTPTSITRGVGPASGCTNAYHARRVREEADAGRAFTEGRAKGEPYRPRGATAEGRRAAASGTEQKQCEKKQQNLEKDHGAPQPGQQNTCLFKETTKARVPCEEGGLSPKAQGVEESCWNTTTTV